MFVNLHTSYSDWISKRLLVGFSVCLLMFPFNRPMNVIKLLLRRQVRNETFHLSIS